MRGALKLEERTMAKRKKQIQDADVDVKDWVGKAFLYLRTH